MKKNLLSIIILALLLVNIVLTTVMMFSVTGTNKQVANLVGNIATVMNLELTQPGQEEAVEVSLKDTSFYAFADSMTMPLAPEIGEDGKQKQGYLVCNVSFSLNTKHKDYKTYGSDDAMAAQEGLIKDAINTIVSKHTATELQQDVGLENLKAEILDAVKELFQSDFIYRVSISEVKYG